MVTFNQLSANEKAALIWHNAEFVMSRYTSQARFNLFSLSGVFIEIQYNLHSNDAEAIQILDEQTLNLYIGSIELL